LIKIPPKNYLRSWEKCLPSRNKVSAVRGRAAYALGKIGGEAVIGPLIELLVTEKESLVREGAAEALGIIGGESAVEPLKNALKDNNEYYGSKVKDVAFISLERISRRIKKRITIEST
jgi:HEAT repeat protein